jgi:hypothetical protein
MSMSKEKQRKHTNKIQNKAIYITWMMMIIHIIPNKHSIQVNEHSQQEASAATPHKLPIRYQWRQYNLHEVQLTAAHENLNYFCILQSSPIPAIPKTRAFYGVSNIQRCLHWSWISVISKMKSHYKRQRGAVQAEKQHNHLQGHLLVRIWKTS